MLSRKSSIEVGFVFLLDCEVDDVFEEVVAIAVVEVSELHCEEGIKVRSQKFKSSLFIICFI